MIPYAPFTPQRAAIGRLSGRKTSRRREARIRGEIPPLDYGTLQEALEKLG